MDAKRFENCKNGMILAINQSITQSINHSINQSINQQTYSSVVFACNKIEYFKKSGLLLFGI